MVFLAYAGLPALLGIRFVSAAHSYGTSLGEVLPSQRRICDLLTWVIAGKLSRKQYQKTPGMVICVRKWPGRWERGIL